jgi:hypothetical protein
MAHLRKIGSSTLIVSNITAADPAYLFLVRASHRISSYSYSANRYSVKRYSYSMAV